MGDNRPNVYQDATSGDRWVFRASSMGSCFSNLVRSALGYTPAPFPASMYDRFEEGNQAEPVMLKWLSEQGWNLWDEHDLEVFASTHNGQMQYLELEPGVLDKAQIELEVPVGKDSLIRVHPDGIATLFLISKETRKRYPELKTGMDVVVEVKAFGPDYYKKYKKEGVDGFPFYRWQVSVEMAATGLPCLFGVGQKDDKGVVKPDKIEWDLITEPPVSLGQLKLKVMKVNKMRESVEEGSEDIPPCDYAMFPCGFWQEHDTESETSVWFKKDVVVLDAKNSEIDLKAVDEWAKVYHEALEAEKELKVVKANAAKELCELFDAEGARGKTAKGDHWVVEDYIGESKGRVDYKKLFEAHGISDEEADKYRSETKVMRYPKVKRKG